MAAKKISKTDRIPKFRSPIRKILNSFILDSPEYKQKIKDGLPFFKKSQLEELSEKYKDGITWNEIEVESSKNGLILKKPTFQKYIRDQIISDKIDYKINSKGRMAVYPAEIIEQINFVQYLYKSTSNHQFFALLDLFQEYKINARELLDEKSYYGKVLVDIMNYVTNRDDDLYMILWETFPNDPDFNSDIINDLNELREYNDNKINLICTKLESYDTINIQRDTEEDKNE